MNHLRNITMAVPFVLFLSSCDDGFDAPSAPPSDSLAQGDNGVRDSMGTVVGSISRAIVKLNGANDKELGLLVRVEVQPNELLEFYEPKPGRLLISAAGAPGGPSMLVPNAKTSPEELWRRATGNRVMPDGLRTAFDRVRRQLPPPEEDRPSPTHAYAVTPVETIGPAKHPTTFTDSEAPSIDLALRGRSGMGKVYADSTTGAEIGPPGWCDNGYFSSLHGAYGHWPANLPPTFTLDKDDWWDGYYAYSNNIESYFVNVCPATAGLLLRVHNTDVNINPTYFNVPPDTVRWHRYVTSCGGTYWDPCFDVRVDVLNAQGTRFHVRFSSTRFDS